MADLTDEDILAELGIEAASDKKSSRTPREERIVAGFEDIQRFVETNGRQPQHGENRDIFERLYAVRLDRMREQAECRDVVEALDHQGLLNDEPSIANAGADLDDDAILAELGINPDSSPDITVLKHVKSRAEIKAAEEIANRTPCADFESFKPLFAQVQKDLDAGTRRTRPFVKDAGFLKADIVKGQFFILGGQTAYIAEVGETLKAPNGEFDARLRVIYSNSTESNLLRRSLQRALYKDEAGRRITEPSAGPLFGDGADDTDHDSGTIYVVRSKSDHPTIAANREIIHKIGVTGGDIASRIASAKTDPTFLLSDVEIVATYELFNINRVKLEALLHTFFAPARLDLQMNDRFGVPFKPREWFLAPIFVINEAVERIRDGSITEYQYDVGGARLVTSSDQ
jgi:hypothetical protein